MARIFTGAGKKRVTYPTLPEFSRSRVGRAAMTSAILKHSIVVDGHKTSVSLEEPFWQALKALAHSQKISVSEAINHIHSQRTQGNLSSAIRVYVLNSVRGRLTHPTSSGTRP
jgi:predicted DNA-binding ribbon-helix-helix protein